MSIEGFSHNTAYNIKIECQNFLKLRRPIIFSKDGKECHKETLLYTAFRAATYVFLALPVGLALIIANHYAKNAVQERIDYWSQKQIFQEPINPECYTEIVKANKLFIEHFAHNNVPKTIAFEKIFIHHCYESHGRIGFGTDSPYRNDRWPAKETKFLNIYWETRPMDGTSQRGWEDGSTWNVLYKMNYNDRCPEARVYGLTDQQRMDIENPSYPFTTGVPEGLEEALITGKIGTQGKKPELSNA